MKPTTVGAIIKRKTTHVGPGTVRYDGKPLTEARIQQLVATNPRVVWQDPKLGSAAWDHDIEEGMHLVYVAMNVDGESEDHETWLQVAFELGTNDYSECIL